MPQPQESQHRWQPSERPIDIDRVLRRKNPALAKRIPRFALSALRSLLHEEDLNRALREFGHLRGLEFVEAALRFIDIEVEVRGEEIPTDDRLLVVANHPLGGLDGLALMSAVGQARKDLCFLVNDLLMNIENLRELFVPVDKHGSNRKYLALYREVLASQKTVLHFPAGLCSRLQRGVVEDLPWHPTFVRWARKYRRSIVPIHVEGTNSRLFYRVARLREGLGIRFGFEMLLLVREMFKKRGSRLVLTVGAPIDGRTLNEDKTDLEWMQEIRRGVLVLGARETSG